MAKSLPAEAGIWGWGKRPKRGTRYTGHDQSLRYPSARSSNDAVINRGIINGSRSGRVSERRGRLAADNRQGLVDKLIVR